MSSCLLPPDQARRNDPHLMIYTSDHYCCRFAGLWRACKSSGIPVAWVLEVVVQVEHIGESVCTHVSAEDRCVSVGLRTHGGEIVFGITLAQGWDLDVKPISLLVLFAS